MKVFAAGMDLATIMRTSVAISGSSPKATAVVVSDASVRVLCVFHILRKLKTLIPGSQNLARCAPEAWQRRSSSSRETRRLLIMMIVPLRWMVWKGNK
jgi:hypothetical protein